MDIVGRFERLCHVEIRRLVLVIGMVVAVIVAFQCFSLPYGKSLFLSLTNKGSVVMVVSNASVINHSKSTKIYAPNDEETGETEEMDMDYDWAEGVENYPYYSFHKDENSQREFTFEKGISLIAGNMTSTDNSSTETKYVEIEHGNLEKVKKVKSNSFDIDDDLNEINGLTLGGVQYKQLPVNFTTKVQNLDANSRTSESAFSANLSSIGNVKQPIETKLTYPKRSQAATANISVIKRFNNQPTSISQMNSLLLQSRVTSPTVRPQWSSVRDRELLFAKVEIENAPVLRDTPGLYASVFRNVSTFKRSYELMESILKVYIYKEGEKPVFHQPFMRGIYASEGWFMKLIEGNRKFFVSDPNKAHLFYIPFSSLNLRNTLLGQKFQSQKDFGQKFRSKKDLVNYLNNYMKLISTKYRFWNRTVGADHFVVACHDLALHITNHMRNCMRALCNSNVARGFHIGMDTSLPVTNIRSAEAPLEELGGKPPLERSTLAFFAGNMHGYLRPILLNFWNNKVRDMKIFGPLPRDIKGKRLYRQYMKSSKYCICARGYEVHTPRVVEAIFYECVPVIIADNYVPPFFEVLNWEAFSVFIPEREIPNLRNILLSIPDEKYLAMQLRVRMAQKHFLWHKKPKKYDLFHMILHSVWYNRVFNVKTK